MIHHLADLANAFLGTYDSRPSRPRVQTTQRSTDRSRVIPWMIVGACVPLKLHFLNVQGELIDAFFISVASLLKLSSFTLPNGP